MVCNCPYYGGASFEIGHVGLKKTIEETRFGVSIYSGSFDFASIKNCEKSMASTR